jgi:RNA polymerase-binding transcription factor DksA
MQLMETWIKEARDALMRRRSRLQLRGAQATQPVQPQGMTLLECECQELCDIEDALVRIQTGAFGWCSRCGGAIGRHRLRAVPEARYCLACSGLVRTGAEEGQPTHGRAHPRVTLTS